MTNREPVAIAVATPDQVFVYRSTREEHDVTLLDDGALRVGVSPTEVVIHAAGQWTRVHTRVGDFEEEAS